MPISGDSFAKLADAGLAKVSVAEIENWIRTLTPHPKNPNPDPGAVTVQRKSAEQIRASMWVQLGLSESDFFSGPAPGVFDTPSVNSFSEDNYPIRSADDENTSFTNEPLTRFAALGGTQALDNRARDLSSSPSFAQALIPLSQQWCKMAISKPSSKALLFPRVDPTLSSSTAAADIKANIAYLGLHFLGDPAQPADVDDVYTSVFLPIEAATDTLTAWAGVCSYYIRHPKWILF
jgi:hypothetical protein